jgi:hypothetical protein
MGVLTGPLRETVVAIFVLLAMVYAVLSLLERWQDTRRLKRFIA